MKLLKILIISGMIMFFSIVDIRHVLAEDEIPNFIISSPQQGDLLKGKVSIIGTAQVRGIVQYEVAFSYNLDGSNTWFPIKTSKQSINSGLLAEWDTNEISDGNYQLRLRLFLKDGTLVEEIIRNLKIRNYTFIETITPLFTQETLNSDVSFFPTGTIELTATNLEDNQITVSTHKVVLTFGLGIIGIVLLIILIWIYTLLK